MTTLQEKMNALTILPSGLFCLYYLIMGKWLLPETLYKASQLIATASDGRGVGVGVGTTSSTFTTIAAAGAAAVAGDTETCLNWKFFPPPTILALCLGIIVHCPCSFLYHWKYAPYLQSQQRLQH